MLTCRHCFETKHEMYTCPCCGKPVCRECAQQQGVQVRPKPSAWDWSMTKGQKRGVVAVLVFAALTILADGCLVVRCDESGDCRVVLTLERQDASGCAGTR